MLYPISGFFTGFILGLILVRFLLKGKTREELRHDKNLHKKYGSLVWLIALMGLIIGIIIKPLFV